MCRDSRAGRCRSPRPHGHARSSSRPDCACKGEFLYSAASNPHDCSKHFTLYSLADLFNLGFSGKQTAMQKLMREDYLYTYMSIYRYSFIQMSELRQCRVNKFAQDLTRQHRIRIRTRVLATALLHYCTTALLHYCTTALLHYCTTALLHYCTTALLHYCTTALLHYCTTALLHYCTTALLHYYKGGRRCILASQGLKLPLADHLP